MFLWGFWKQRSVSASVRKTLSEPTFRPKTSPKHFEIKLIQHYFSIISEMETMTSFMWTISAVLQVLPRVICYWNHRVCFQWSAPCRYKPYLLLERETVIFWTTVRIGQISEHRETGVSTRPPSCCDITQVESPGATHRIYHLKPLKLLQFAFLEAQTKRGDKVKAGLATWFCLQKVVSMKLLEPDCLGLVMQINE